MTNIKNNLLLLEDIGRQLTKLEKKNPEIRLSCISVRLYEDNKEILDARVGLAIEWIASDVYYDENTNWANADRAEVYVM